MGYELKSLSSDGEGYTMLNFRKELVSWLFQGFDRAVHSGLIADCETSKLFFLAPAVSYSIPKIASNPIPDPSDSRNSRVPLCL